MHIFVTDLQITADTATALCNALPPEHTQRASSLAAAVAYHLVRYAVRRVSPLTDTRHWELDENGKPHLAAGAPCFNLSHSRYGVAVAVDDCQVGIDLEEIRPHHPDLPRRYYTEAEQALIDSSHDPTSELIRIWTAKEAVAKQLGTGIDKNFRNIPTNGVQNARITLGSTPHWLSISPANEMPPLVWVTAEQLLLDI